MLLSRMRLERTPQGPKEAASGYRLRPYRGSPKGRRSRACLQPKSPWVKRKVTTGELETIMFHHYDAMMLCLLWSGVLSTTKCFFFFLGGGGMLLLKWWGRWLWEQEQRPTCSTDSAWWVWPGSQISTRPQHWSKIWRSCNNTWRILSRRRVRRKISARSCISLDLGRCLLGASIATI